MAALVGGYPVVGGQVAGDLRALRSLLLEGVEDGAPQVAGLVVVPLRVLDQVRAEVGDGFSRLMAGGGEVGVPLDLIGEKLLAAARSLRELRHDLLPQPLLHRVLGVPEVSVLDLLLLLSVGPARGGPTVDLDAARSVRVLEHEGTGLDVASRSRV